MAGQLVPAGVHLPTVRAGELSRTVEILYVSLEVGYNGIRAYRIHDGRKVGQTYH